VQGYDAPIVDELSFVFAKGRTVRIGVSCLRRSIAIDGD
jgi:hypothetical protein